MKKLSKLTVFFIALAFAFIFGNNSAVHATSFDDCSIPTVNNISEFDNLSAAYTQKVSAAKGDKEGITSYFKFTLNEDSWVKFTGNFSLNQHNGGQTHVSIYSDSSLSNKKGDYGWGYWEHDNRYTAFLTKGTYYCVINTKQANYSDFVANVNVMAGAIPVSGIFDFQIQTPANKNYATVSITDKLGSYVKAVQYRSGSVSLENVNNNNYWQSPGGIRDVKDVTFLTLENDKYAFRADKNDSYTIMIQDIDGNRYSAIVSVKDIDTEKPIVKGVKNKKTYKKAVKIKFSDKGSGIKSAKLNGKKIKSGKKVSKPGTYKLVVTDKADNKTSIKFYIKKK